MAVVLVVEQDEVERARLSWWLREDGHVVLECSGPRAPDFVCPSGSPGRCALAGAADAVVLDLQLASDTMQEGTPGWQMLQLYAEAGTPVVALADAGDPVFESPDDGIHIIHRPPLRRQLLDGLGAVLAGARRGRSAEPAGVPDLTVVHRPGARAPARTHV